MTISVFPSQLDGSPIEVYDFSGVLADWFSEQGIDFSSKNQQPITLTVDGVPVPPSEWHSFSVDEEDEVEIRIIPHGWVNLLYAAIVAITIASYIMARRAPVTANTSTPQGRNLDSSTADANRAMLGSVVPELAGRFRRFPDYLTQPRRYFISERQQALEFLCCIGPGEYQINDEDVKVGDTPFASIGEDANYQIYDPAEDLSSDPAHINWYVVNEVGGTSSGTAGLELSAEFVDDINPSPGTYTFSGSQISLPTVGPIFPQGWGNGTIITARFPRSYVVTREGDGDEDPYINTFAGNVSNIMQLINGDIVQATGLPYSTVRIANLSIDSVGNGTFRLEHETESGWVLIGEIVPSTINITLYKTGRTYRVMSRTDKIVTVQALDAGIPATGWPGWYEISTSSAIFTVDPNSIFGDWTNWFRACPNKEKTTVIENDFFFPQGLGFVNDNGSISNYGVSVEVEWRDADGLLTGGDITYSYSRATADQIGFTQRITIPSMTPEVRVRRRGAYNPEQRIRSTVQWYGLRCILPGVTSYQNWTTMAVSLRTGGRISAQSENKINVVATRILPILQSGEFDAPQPTRDISAFVRYICSTIGYGESQINMEELSRLDQIWKSRGETADYIFDETTVKDALNTVLGAGMSELTVSDGQIKPVRDDVRTQFEQSYSPQNMTTNLVRKFSSPKQDDPDGVEVEYINGETWEKETIDCLLPGDMGYKKERLKLNAVIDKTRAWRIGMRRRRDIKYRRWQYSFDTEMDALNSDYLSYCAIFDDIPGYGQSSLMRDIRTQGDKTIITSGEPISWEAGENHIVAFRRDDGTLEGPFAAQKGIDEYTIETNIPINLWPVLSLKKELPHLYIGTAERFTFPSLITEIRPRNTDSVEVSAINYDVRVYADDNNSPE